MNLAKIHHLATWTPEADPIEFRLDQIRQRLDNLTHRLDNIETGIDDLRATILRAIQDGGTR